MLVTAKFDLHPELPNKNPVDCSHAQIASAIKMAILNYAKHLPLNLQMGNLLLETIINFLIAIEPFLQIYSFYHALETTKNNIYY